MNNYSQIAYTQAMMNNNVWMAIALSKSNNNPHHPQSAKVGMCICGGVLLLMIIAFIATCIIIRVGGKLNECRTDETCKT